MKERVITGAVMVVFAIVALCFYMTPVFNITIAVISAVAIYEILSAIGAKKNKGMYILSVGYGVVMSLLPRVHYYRLDDITVLYVLALFLIYLLNHKNITIDKLGVTFFMTMVITFGYNCGVFLVAKYSADALFYLLLSMICAWGSDTFAFFTGKLFGKHKLAPEISPKKTIEGAIGGLLAGALLSGLCAYVYPMFVKGVTINVWLCMLVGIGVSLMGMFGDLSMSMIKRQCGIKDYGTIFPGHGGMLDRFDSVLFTIPTVYLLAQYFPLVVR